MTEKPTMVYVLHEISSHLPDLSQDRLVALMGEWSKTVHLDLYVMPLLLAQKLVAENQRFTIHSKAGENSNKVQETADNLYANSYPSDVYHQPLAALNAAITIEEA